MSGVIPSTIPHGRTARRLDWAHLPPTVRRRVEHLIGTTVEHSISQDGGYTPGFASILLGTDGTRHFVKAASVKAQRAFAESYRIEARRLRSLPASAPAPRLLWAEEIDDWMLLETEYVDGHAPQRPWEPAELASASRMLVEAAAILTPAPGLGLDTAVDDWADWPALWELIDLPHAAACQALAEGFAAVVAGETLVHADVRDDNLIVRHDGSMALCDWNWPVRGAAWLDSLILLIGPRGDGLDVEAHIAAHPLLSSVDPEPIDTVLALVLGYFAHSAVQPSPATSPYVRRAQAWQRDVILEWLIERRGWRFGD
jgi:hypothetical protein